MDSAGDENEHESKPEPEPVANDDPSDSLEERGDTSSASLGDVADKTPAKESPHLVASLNASIAKQRASQVRLAAAESDKADLNKQLVDAQRELAAQAVKQQNAAPPIAADDLFAHLEQMLLAQEHRTADMLRNINTKVNMIGEEVELQGGQINLGAAERAELDESLRAEARMRREASLNTNATPRASIRNFMAANTARPSSTSSVSGGDAQIEEVSVPLLSNRRDTSQLSSKAVERLKSDIPKQLRGGELSVEFNNKPTENVARFLHVCERELRHVATTYWIDCVLLACSATVRNTAESYGLSLYHGRVNIKTEDNSSIPCPAGWYYWAEFKEWMLVQYHRPGADMQIMVKLMTSLRQTHSFEAYLNKWREEYQLLDDGDRILNEKWIKAIYMANMRTETCDRLKSEPENYDLDLAKFVLKSVKIDEVVYSQKGKNKGAASGRVAALDASESSTDKDIAALKAQVAQLTVQKPGTKPPSSGRGGSHPDPESEEGRARWPSDSGPCPYCHEDHGIRFCYKVFVKNHPGEKIPKKIAGSIPDWKKDQFQLAALTAGPCAVCPAASKVSFEEVTDSDDDDDDDYVDCNMAPLAVAKSQVITAGPSDNVTIFVQNYPGREVSTKDQDLMLKKLMKQEGVDVAESDSKDLELKIAAALHKYGTRSRKSKCDAAESTSTSGTATQEDAGAVEDDDEYVPRIDGSGIVHVHNCVIGGENVTVMIDSGCNVSSINEHWVDRHRSALLESGIVFQKSRPMSCNTAGSGILDTRQVLRDPEISMDKFKFRQTLQVLPLASCYDIILGTDMLTGCRGSLSFDPDSAERFLVRTGVGVDRAQECIVSRADMSTGWASSTSASAAALSAGLHVCALGPEYQVLPYQVLKENYELLDVPFGLPCNCSWKDKWQIAKAAGPSSGYWHDNVILDNLSAPIVGDEGVVAVPLPSTSAVLGKITAPVKISADSQNCTRDEASEGPFDVALGISTSQSSNTIDTRDKSLQFVLQCTLALLVCMLNFVVICYGICTVIGIPSVVRLPSAYVGHVFLAACFLAIVLRFGSYAFDAKISDQFEPKIDMTRPVRKISNKSEAVQKFRSGALKSSNKSEFEEESLSEMSTALLPRIFSEHLKKSAKSSNELKNSTQVGTSAHVPGVICALKSCGSSNLPKHKHLGEIELVSHRRFKGRLRKSIKKQVAGEGNQEAFMLNAVVSSPAEMASLTVQSPTRRSPVCRSVIAALALLSVAALNMFNDSAYDPATAAINASKTTPAVANEFLPPTADILAAVNVQVPEAAPYMERIKSVGHETFKDIPHKSQINRPINETMSIRFKEGFENHVPPPKFYPCAIPLLPILKEALTEMLNSGFIRPSNSPFSAPCLIIPKPHQEKVPFKDKKWRVCVDLRDVNELTVRQHHRIPNIQKCWSRLSSAKYLSVLDLTKGFYQENLNPDDGSIEKTAFSTEYGHFEYVGTPMGAKNTPAFFQKRVEAALKKDDLIDTGLLRYAADGSVELDDNLGACVTPYIDDLIIYSESLADHERDLNRVLRALSENQYYVNMEKCSFFCRYAKFVGGIVGNGLLAMDPAKVESVAAWEQPTTVTELKSFLGMTNYLKQWYNEYSNRSAVLTDLLKKGKSVSVDWSDDCTKAFLELKAGFAKYPILRLPQFDKPFYLITDSCDHAIGGALLQMYECADGSKQLLPVAYHSRTMNGAERNYPVREQEMLALHACFKNFEYLILGSSFEVVCKTDHNTLTQVQKGGALTNRRLARWQEYLGGFDYKITYLPGLENFVGDGISRSLRIPHDPLPAATTTIPWPSIAPLQSVGFAKYDERCAKMDYSRCSDFKDIVAHLLGDDTTTEAEVRSRYFTWYDDKLWYTHSDGTQGLCIPSDARSEPTEESPQGLPLREVLIQECHDTPYCGHRGINRTYAQLRTLFYFPKMHAKVARFVRSCEKCARAKSSSRGEVGQLGANECPNYPMHSVTIDMMTNLPPASGTNHNQAVVLVDRFTKKVFAFSMLGTATAMELARELYDRIFLEFGFPLEIISDRDTKFVSKVWTELFKLTGTKLTMAYAYHQRFDGQTEVMNKTMEEIMRCYVDYNQSNWASQLPHVCAAINNSPNPTSGLSPNKIFYGRFPMRPVELKFGGHEDVTAVEFLTEMTHSRQVASETVREAIVRMTVRHNSQLSKSKVAKSSASMGVGTFVTVAATNLTRPGFHRRPSRKLRSKREGPFEVIKVLSATGRRLRLPPGWRQHPEFHINKLVPFEFAPELEVRAAEPEPDLNAAGEDVYEVESLASRATIRGRVSYFIKWVGYPVEDGEWRSRDDLLLGDTCADLIRDFEARLPL